MTTHEFKPFTEETSKMVACVNCGKIVYVDSNPVYPDCEHYLALGRWSWGPGQRDYPFSWDPSLPVRREFSLDEREGKFDLPKTDEKRPGLAPETIDQDAYREFMRSL